MVYIFLFGIETVLTRVARQLCTGVSVFKSQSYIASYVNSLPRCIFVTFCTGIALEISVRVNQLAATSPKTTQYTLAGQHVSRLTSLSLVTRIVSLSTGRLIAALVSEGRSFAEQVMHRTHRITLAVKSRLIFSSVAVFL